METKLKKSSGLSLYVWIVLCFFMCFSGSSSVLAATITVDADGSCTLADAISAANSNVATGGCIAGDSGSDTIFLKTDVTVPITTLENFTETATLSCNGYTIDGSSIGATERFIGIQGTGGANRAVLTVDQCTLTGGNIYHGGAIFLNQNADLILKDSTLRGNHATGSGGGIYISVDCTAYIENSTITGNSSGSNGGAISVVRGTLELVNSTISGNDAQRGGGIFVYFGSSVTVRNSTISYNTTTSDGAADEGGGGIKIHCPDLNCNDTPANVTLIHSIVSGNRSANTNHENEILINDTSAGFTVDNDNIFGDAGERTAEAFSNFTPGTNDYNATSDGNNTALTSILAPLADNGGTTKTHALITGSPAIDFVSSCTVTTDQRHLDRPAAGNSCDAGAYEFAAYDPCGYRDLAANTWTMTAPPCAPDPVAVDLQLREDLNGVYATNWIAYSRDNNNQNYIRMNASDPLIQGNGYWLYSTNAGRMRIAGTATPVIDCGTEYGFTTGTTGNLCFAVALNIPAENETEQNMIGHPFPYTVDWADVRIAAGSTGSWTLYSPSAAETAGYISKTYFVYNGSGYQSYDDITTGEIGVLQPQQSIWVKSINPAQAHSLSSVHLLIPAQ